MIKRNHRVITDSDLEEDAAPAQRPLKRLRRREQLPRSESGQHPEDDRRLDREPNSSGNVSGAERRASPEPLAAPDQERPRGACQKAAPGSDSEDDRPLMLLSKVTSNRSNGQEPRAAGETAQAPARAADHSGTGQQQLATTMAPPSGRGLKPTAAATTAQDSPGTSRMRRDIQKPARFRDEDHLYGENAAAGIDAAAAADDGDAGDHPHARHAPRAAAPAAAAAAQPRRSAWQRARTQRRARPSYGDPSSSDAASSGQEGAGSASRSDPEEEQEQEGSSDGGDASGGRPMGARRSSAQRACAKGSGKKARQKQCSASPERTQDLPGYATRQRVAAAPKSATGPGPRVRPCRQAAKSLGARAEAAAPAEANAEHAGELEASKRHPEMPYKHAFAVPGGGSGAAADTEGSGGEDDEEQQRRPRQRPRKLVRRDSAVAGPSGAGAGGAAAAAQAAAPPQRSLRQPKAKQGLSREQMLQRARQKVMGGGPGLGDIHKQEEVGDEDELEIVDDEQDQGPAAETSGDAYGDHRRAANGRGAEDDYDLSDSFIADGGEEIGSEESDDEQEEEEEEEVGSRAKRRGDSRAAEGGGGDGGDVDPELEDDVEEEVLPEGGGSGRKKARRGTAGAGGAAEMHSPPVVARRREEFAEFCDWLRCLICEHLRVRFAGSANELEQDRLNVEAARRRFEQQIEDRIAHATGFHMVSAATKLGLLREMRRFPLLLINGQPAFQHFSTMTPEEYRRLPKFPNLRCREDLPVDELTGKVKCSICNAVRGHHNEDVHLINVQHPAAAAGAAKQPASPAAVPAECKHGAYGGDDGRGDDEGEADNDDDGDDEEEQEEEDDQAHYMAGSKCLHRMVILHGLMHIKGRLLAALKRKIKNIKRLRPALCKAAAVLALINDEGFVRGLHNQYKEVMRLAELMYRTENNRHEVNYAGRPVSEALWLIHPSADGYESSVAAFSDEEGEEEGEEEGGDDADGGGGGGDKGGAAPGGGGSDGDSDSDGGGGPGSRRRSSHHSPVVRRRLVADLDEAAEEESSGAAGPSGLAAAGAAAPAAAGAGGHKRNRRVVDSDSDGEGGAEPTTGVGGNGATQWWAPPDAAAATQARAAPRSPAPAPGSMVRSKQGKLAAADDDDDGDEAREVAAWEDVEEPPPPSAKRSTPGGRGSRSPGAGLGVVWTDSQPGDGAVQAAGRQSRITDFLSPGQRPAAGGSSSPGAPGRRPVPAGIVVVDLLDDTDEEKGVEFGADGAATAAASMGVAPRQSAGVSARQPELHHAAGGCAQAAVHAWGGAMRAAGEQGTVGSGAGDPAAAGDGGRHGIEAAAPSAAAPGLMDTAAAPSAAAAGCTDTAALPAGAAGVVPSSTVAPAGVPHDHAPTEQPAAAPQAPASAPPAAPQVPAPAQQAAELPEARPLAEQDVEPRMPFSHHAGTPLADLDDDFVAWMCRDPKFFNPAPATEVKAWLLQQLMRLGRVRTDRKGEHQAVPGTQRALPRPGAPPPASSVDAGSSGPLRDDDDDDDEPVITFGQHRGEPLASLDDGYIGWMCRDDIFDSTHSKQELLLGLLRLGRVRLAGPGLVPEMVHGSARKQQGAAALPSAGSRNAGAGAGPSQAPVAAAGAVAAGMVVNSSAQPDGEQQHAMHQPGQQQQRQQEEEVFGAQAPQPLLPAYCGSSSSQRSGRGGGGPSLAQLLNSASAAVVQQLQPETGASAHAQADGRVLDAVHEGAESVAAQPELAQQQGNQQGVSGQPSMPQQQGQQQQP